MAATVIGGPFDWKMTRDNEGGREYKVTYHVQVGANEGPYVARNASGLPLIGSSWAPYGATSELDTWALCLPEREVVPEVSTEETNLYKVTCTFGTAPLSRCAINEKTNPLLEPIKITGTFQKYTDERWQNYDGTIIKSSSHEQIRGKEVEFDFNRPTIKVEMNVGTVQQNLLTQFIDCVNDATMWGFAPRCVKLSNVSWERLFYGTCSCYFRWTLEFDVNYDTFDRFVADQGTKVLRGQWRRLTSGTGSSTGTSASAFYWQKDSTASESNPMDFVRYQDPFGNLVNAFLDGHGNPASVLTNLGTGTHVETGTGGATTGANAKIAIRAYPSVNFALLGVPTTLNCTS